MTDISHMHTMRQLGGIEVLVAQLVSPQPDIQQVAAQILRHAAAIGTAGVVCDNVCSVRLQRSAGNAQINKDARV